MTTTTHSHKAWTDQGGHGSSTSADVSDPFEAVEAMIAAAASKGRWLDQQLRCHGSYRFTEWSLLCHSMPNDRCCTGGQGR